MGLRFRKTVSLGKGVRLNFSKSGMSTSIGPRGASLSFGKRGTYANVGIPGTGISYRKRIDSPGGSRQAGGNSATAGSRNNADQKAIEDIAAYTGNPAFSFSVGISDDGTIVFLNADGTEINDQKLLSLLKKHPMYKENKGALEAEAIERQRAYAEELANETQAFINNYQLSPLIKTEMDFMVARSKLAPEPYKVQPFDLPRPTEEEVRTRLTTEAEGRIKSVLPWKKSRAIAEYVDAQLAHELSAELRKWDDARKRHDASEEVRKIDFEEKADRKYRRRLKRINGAIDGNPSYIDWAAGKWFERCRVPVDIAASYDYDNQAKMLSIDLDLPEIEDLPRTQAVQLASGKYKVKDKTQKQLKEEYVTCVLGLVVFVASSMFNVSPRIEAVSISGFTQRRNKSGAVSDEYIVSVRFTRKEMRSRQYAADDPRDTVSAFENRMYITSSSVMKAIEPL